MVFRGLPRPARDFPLYSLSLRVSTDFTTLIHVNSYPSVALSTVVTLLTLLHSHMSSTVVTLLTLLHSHMSIGILLCSFSWKRTSGTPVLSERGCSKVHEIFFFVFS
jgi:hypothetical protein